MPANTRRPCASLDQVSRHGSSPPDMGVWAVTLVVIVTVVVVVAIGVAAVPSRSPQPTRGDQAATARLQGQADAYEAVRAARANRADSAPLQGRAEVARAARVNRAASVRLQGLAHQYGIS